MTLAHAYALHTPACPVFFDTPILLFYRLLQICRIAYAIFYITTCRDVDRNLDSGRGLGREAREGISKQNDPTDLVVGNPQALTRPQSCNSSYLYPPSRRHGHELFHSLE
jgi:hypothetical protein